MSTAIGVGRRRDQDIVWSAHPEGRHGVTGRSSVHCTSSNKHHPGGRWEDRRTTKKEEKNGEDNSKNDRNHGAVMAELFPSQSHRDPEIIQAPAMSLDRLLYVRPLKVGGASSSASHVFRGPSSGSCIERYVQGDDGKVPASSQTSLMVPNYTTCLSLIRCIVARQRRCTSFTPNYESKGALAIE